MRLILVALVSVTALLFPAPAQASAVTAPAFQFGTRFGPLRLTHGWMAATCQPDEHFVCLADGRRDGYAEWRTFPIEPGVDLRERARQFLADLEADRAAGCPGFRFHAEPIVSAPVIGLRGIRLSFTLARDGRVVERTVAYWADELTRLFVLSAEALDDGSCLERLGDQFRVAELRRAEPALGRLAATGAAPPPDAPTSPVALLPQMGRIR
jgi:hypothetical protein